LKNHSAYKTLREAYLTSHNSGMHLRHAEVKAAEAEMASKKKEKASD
jgi:hypothetical protein